MKIQYSIIKRSLTITIGCFSLLLFCALVTWADGDQPGSKESAKGSALLSKQQVTLQKKNSQMVSTAIGERYDINSATMIIGQDGEQVLIQYLLVPCDVNLTFESHKDGSRLVHRIEILNVHEGATNRMWQKPM